MKRESGFQGAGSSAAIDSLMEELLSTSSPDLGHVEEVCNLFRNRSFSRNCLCRL